MSNLRNWMKRELDVEIMASAYGMSFLWIYAFLLWIYGNGSVTIVEITEMLILGYLISWFQKVLFLKETSYGKLEYLLRVVLWNIGPTMMIILSQFLFKWFEGLPDQVAILYDGIVLIYFLIVWGLIRILYKEETIELNQMLKEFKGGK